MGGPDQITVSVRIDTVVRNSFGPVRNSKVNGPEDGSKFGTEFSYRSDVVIM